MKLSIIIPTLNEEDLLPDLLQLFVDNPQHSEVIIVDGGSVDNTKQIANSFGHKVYESRASRAVQMNLGVKYATGNVLYFVHADALPPASYYQDIQEAINLGYESGCYRFKFKGNHPLLKVNSYFTRFNQMWCRGGDQTLFIKKDLFQLLKGYNEYYSIMEEYDLIRTLINNYSFKVIQKDVLVSARKYDKNGWLKVQLTNLKAFKMYKKGFPPEEIKKFYEAKLK